jgi:putative addiction module component (TIGR02574 family)
MDLRSVLTEVESWPAEERLRLIAEVWEGLEAEPDSASLGEAQERDLERRLEAHRDSPKAGSPWDEVKARLRGRGR